jgi:hypothetical protein
MSEVSSILTGVVTRLEGETASINLSNGQQLDWPVTKLSAGVVVGETVKLILVKEGAAESQAVAQEILNQIFSPDDKEVGQ